MYEWINEGNYIYMNLFLNENLYKLIKLISNFGLMHARKRGNIRYKTIKVN